MHTYTTPIPSFTNIAEANMQLGEILVCSGLKMGFGCSLCRRCFRSATELLEPAGYSKHILSLRWCV